ncbi:MAG: hypothetical protein M1302_05260 [Candidatus Thermoplasmatota archaeon]|nr:hypothetical protein [Candidatus Thermoplasmatota archaeon]
MTAENDTFSINVIKTGESEVPAPEVYWMEGWNEWEKLSFHALLLRNSNMNFLINTGLPSDLTERNKAMVDFGGERCIFKPSDISKELNHLGVEPSEVNGIAFTPLQDYTTGGIQLFRNAKIYMDRKGWTEDIVAPSVRKHQPRNMFIPEQNLKYLMFDAWNRVVLFDSLFPYSIAPGLTVMWVGCHHRSSLAFQISTRSGNVIFSDCSFKRRNLEANIPIGIAENTLECLDTYSRFRGKGTFLSAYDPEIDGLEF